MGGGWYDGPPPTEGLLMPPFSLHAHLTTLRHRWLRRSEESSLSQKYQASPVLVDALKQVLGAPAASTLSSQELSQKVLEAIPFHGSGVDEYAKWELRACLMDHAVSAPVVALHEPSPSKPLSRLARRILRGVGR